MVTVVYATYTYAPLRVLPLLASTAPGYATRMRGDTPGRRDADAPARPRCRVPQTPSERCPLAPLPSQSRPYPKPQATGRDATSVRAHSPRLVCLSVVIVFGLCLSLSRLRFMMQSPLQTRSAHITRLGDCQVPHSASPARSILMEWKAAFPQRERGRECPGVPARRINRRRRRPRCFSETSPSRRPNSTFRPSARTRP